MKGSGLRLSSDPAFRHRGREKTGEKRDGGFPSLPLRNSSMSRIRNVRNAARALIVCDGRLLACKMRDAKGVFYVLPGGGQRPGETLRETLERECQEEIGVPVRVGDLIYVREYIGKNHSFRDRHSGFHQVEMVFRCEIDCPDQPCMGEGQDNLQIGIAWLPLERVKEFRLLPSVLKEFVAAEPCVAPRLYLGDIN